MPRRPTRGPEIFPWRQVSNLPEKVDGHLRPSVSKENKSVSEIALAAAAVMELFVLVTEFLSGRV
jgi:hypothetical protein